MCLVLIVLDYHVIVTLYLLPAYILCTVSIVPLLHLLTTVSTLLISLRDQPNILETDDANKHMSVMLKNKRDDDAWTDGPVTRVVLIMV